MAAMTYESIVAAVRKKLSKADVSSIPGTLAFQVDVEGKAEGIFYIEIKDGQLHVEPYDYHDRNARLIINGTNLMKLVNGKLDPVLAFTTGKLKVDGDTNAAIKVSGFDRCTDKRCTCFTVKQGRRFFLSCEGQEVRLVLCFRDFGKNPISFFLFSQKVLETTGKYCIM